MQWNVEVPKDFEPEFMLGATAQRNITRLIVVAAIVAGLALAAYFFLTRPVYTFEGHGTGTIDVGRVTLDGTYRMAFTASTSAARIWLWQDAGICETANEADGLMLISADRCIAHLTIVAGDTIDYKVEIRSVN